MVRWPEDIVGEQAVLVATLAGGGVRVLWRAEDRGRPARWLAGWLAAQRTRIDARELDGREAWVMVELERVPGWEEPLRPVGEGAVRSFGYGAIAPVHDGVLVPLRRLLGGAVTALRDADEAAVPPRTALVPHDKFDLDTAGRAVAAGWPTVEPFLPELVDWCLDGNWPVSRVLMPFIASLGVCAAPLVQAVLDGDDGPAKYFLLGGVVADMPVAAVASLEPSLRRIVDQPSQGEIEEELPAMARDLIARLS